jgi:hypothetical protein
MNENKLTLDEIALIFVLDRPNWYVYAESKQVYGIVPAIIAYRKRTGVSLKDAKETLDSFVRKNLVPLY